MVVTHIRTLLLAYDGHSEEDGGITVGWNCSTDQLQETDTATPNRANFKPDTFTNISYLTKSVPSKPLPFPFIVGSHAIHELETNHSDYSITIPHPRMPQRVLHRTQRQSSALSTSTSKPQDSLFFVRNEMLFLRRSPTNLQYTGPTNFGSIRHTYSFID